MSRLARLPRLMLAPNGARRGKADHPALPITIAETVATAQAAHAVGAQALHAHVRDETGRHVLDAGLYAELIAEMGRAVPDMPVQITTEAIGRYSPAEQRALVQAVRPEGVSVALAELWPDDGEAQAAQRFYAWTAEAGIAVQHILYSPAQVSRFSALANAGQIARPAGGPHQVLFVLGTYAPPAPAHPTDLAPYLKAVRPMSAPVDWAVCAFGAQEEACLIAAAQQGGGVRIGFENNIQRPDGGPAVDNSAQVAALLRACPTLAP